MLRKIALVSISALTIVILWQIVEEVISADQSRDGLTSIEAFIPTPLTIARTLLDQGGIIILHLSFTLERAMVGFLIGTLLGISMAIVFFFFPTIRGLTLPLAFSVNSFPIVGFAPIFILAFGQGSWMSIVSISALICYFPILLNMDAALQNTDKNLIDLSHVLNATRWQELTMIRLPLAIPQLFLAMKLAVPASIIGATIGEWLGTRNGIGHLTTIALYQLKPGLLYASLIILALASTLLIMFLSILQSKLSPMKE